MRSVSGKRVIGAALAVLIAGAASAATVPERRVTRAPRAPAEQAAPAPRQDLLELYTQLETLQQQLREMRGLVEVQAHEIERLNRRQMESMVDFDRRLREMERRNASTAGTGSATAKVDTPPVSTAPTAAARASTPTLDEQKQYDAAFALMKQGLYEQASKAFRDFVARSPKSALADNAQYWVAEIAYVTRNFRGAIEEFGKVVNNYPDSPKVPDALLKLGYTHQELGANDKAREVLQSVIVRYPNTTVAKAAEQRLAKLPKTN